MNAPFYAVYKDYFNGFIFKVVDNTLYWSDGDNTLRLPSSSFCEYEWYKYRPMKDNNLLIRIYGSWS